MATAHAMYQKALLKNCIHIKHVYLRNSPESMVQTAQASRKMLSYDSASNYSRDSLCCMRFHAVLWMMTHLLEISQLVNHSWCRTNFKMKTFLFFILGKFFCVVKEPRAPQISLIFFQLRFKVFASSFKFFLYGSVNSLLVEFPLLIFFLRINEVPWARKLQVL